MWIIYEDILKMHYVNGCKCSMFCLFPGETSALHMLVKVGHEVISHGIEECACLELLCRYKPYTEEKNSAGKTPLAVAVEGQSMRAVGILVSSIGLYTVNIEKKIIKNLSISDMGNMKLSDFVMGVE